MGKGSSGAGSAFDYFGTIAGAVCAGPVKALLAFEVDGKIVWPKAAAWAASTYPPGSLVLHEGRFYTTASSTTATPPGAPWTIYRLSNATRNADGYTEFTVEGYGPQNNARFYWGFDDQVADPILNAHEAHPPYLRTAYFVLVDFLAGRERQSFPSCRAVVECEPRQATITGTAANLVDGQANAAAVAASLIENRTDALGLANVSPDAASFQAAADALEPDAAKTYVSVLIDRQTTIRDIAGKLGEGADLWLRVDHDRIKAGRWPRTSTPSIALQVTPGMLTSPPKLVSTGWSGASTGVNFRFRDRTRNFKQTSDTVDELRALAIIGEHRRETLDLEFVTRAEQARSVAVEWLRKKGQPRITGDLSLRRSWGLSVKPGDFIELDVDLEPNGTQALLPFKVLERSIPPNGAIKFKIESDATQWPVYVTPVDDTPAFGFAETVEAVADVRFIDAPMGLGGVFSAIIPLAVRPNKRTIGFQLLYDSALDADSDFEDIGQFSGFAVKASLAADLAVNALGDADTLPVDGTPSASVLRLSVAAQTDRETLFSSIQPSIVGSADDKLLLVLVEGSGSFPAETSEGLARVEVFSVDSWEAYGSGEPRTYALKALRARRGTVKAAFTAANTEAWLVWRDALTTGFHADFPTIRTNREKAISGSVQDFNLRVQPFTPSARRPSSSLTSVSMRFPLAAPWKPRLSWEAEAPAFPYSLASEAGGTVRLRGTWRDTGGDIASYSIAYRLSGADQDTLVDAQTAGGRDAITFDRTITLPANTGADKVYQITLRATDKDGLTSELVVEAIVPAAPASTQVATPTFSPPGGGFPYGALIPLPAITLACATSGATIKWQWRKTGQLPSVTWNTYSTPLPMVLGSTLYAYALKAGSTDSGVKGESYYRSY